MPKFTLPSLSNLLTEDLPLFYGKQHHDCMRPIGVELNSLVLSRQQIPKEEDDDDREEEEEEEEDEEEEGGEEKTEVSLHHYQEAFKSSPQAETLSTYNIPKPEATTSKSRLSLHIPIFAPMAYCNRCKKTCRREKRPRTTFFCPACQLHLCCKQRRNCFATHHIEIENTKSQERRHFPPNC